MVAAKAMQASTTARTTAFRSRARGRGGIGPGNRFTPCYIPSCCSTSPKRRSAIAIKRELDPTSASMRFNQSYNQEVRLLSGLELPSKAELDSLSVLYHAFGTRRRRQLKSFEVAIGTF